jgi:hypothetical protein
MLEDRAGNVRPADVVITTGGGRLEMRDYERTRTGSIGRRIKH